MAFNRSPRFQTPFNPETVEIPTAPAIPQKPESTNWLTILLPIGAVLVSIVLMISLMGSSASGLSYLIFIPVMLVSYLAAIITGNVQKKTYAKEIEKARAKFRSDLRVTEERLIAIQKEESRLRNVIDPDLGECIQRAQASDSRLGERRPDDADFLHIRVGLGKVSAAYQIQNPDIKNPPEEFKGEFEFITQITEKYSVLNSAPILIRLPKTGSVGFAGPRDEILDISRAVLSHLLTHHWPDEVKLAVICKENRLSDWRWINALPHTSPLNNILMQAGSETKKDLTSKTLSALEVELQRREQLAAANKLVQKDDNSTTALEIPLPRLLVVFDYLDPDLNHSALNLLYKKGPELGVYGIFLRENLRQVPGACGGALHFNANSLIYFESGPEGYRQECQADRLNLSQVEVFARTLSAIQWPKALDSSQPPDMITFLQLFGVSRVEDLPLEAWWNNQSPYGTLRAPIGRISATSDMVFDLNDRDGAHGPHGLLGGMTGSGKSEVLKAIILALAVTHHPYDLNFALIDFKGGAAFNELAKLPHTVGVVTDIESNATFAERVIQALSGEIEHRKRVLENARAAFRFGRSHIDEYRKLRVRRPLPRLVIVFDEFAEFKQRNPAESKKLISIARQGRSLGVHLILATQNIGAAVDPEILQNSTFRICLKVSEPQDSIQMIGIPDAINLNRGRAYFSANSRVLYQSAYSGANYISRDSSLPNTMTRVLPGGKREVVDAPRWGTPVLNDSGQPSTEASAVVEYIIEVSRKLHLKKPPAVWPDALPERLYLPDLLEKHVTGGWNGKNWSPCQQWGEPEKCSKSVHPVLGLYDLPIQQRQVVFQIDPESGGHLLIFGSSGSGKSALLRTMVTSLAMTQTPAEAWVYILDFGGQSALKVLEPFPHVGAVVTRLELERAERLIQFIRSEVSKRNHLLRDAKVDSWIDYNEKVEQSQKIPALYLIIDGFPQFKQAFESEFINSVTGLVSGGQASGLFLIAASPLQSDIPNDLFANIQMRLTFNQADATEYFRLAGQPSDAKLSEDAAKGVRPGRGLLRGTPPIEFQAALPRHGETDKEQIESLFHLGEAMNEVWRQNKGVKPPEIRTLPLLVTLPVVKQHSPLTKMPSSSMWSMLGQDFETLEPIGFDLMNDGPAFLIGGVAQQTGKTTLLTTWLLGLAQQYSPERLKMIVVDFHTRSLLSLRHLSNVCDYVGNLASLAQVLTKLGSEIQQRQEIMDHAWEDSPDTFNSQEILSKWPAWLVVIDDYEKFRLKAEDYHQQLADCLQRGGELGVNFIVSGKMAELPQDYQDSFIARFRRLGSGILLGGVEGVEAYNNTRRPIGQPNAGLPVGRGYLIGRGRARLFQAAAYWQPDETASKALENRVAQINKNAK